MTAVGFLLAAIFSLGAAEPQVGVVRHGEIFELSVIFPEPVERTSLLSLENYRISAGELIGLRETATNQGVILSATGLQPNTAGILSITGVWNSASAELPPSLIGFETGERFWAAIGGSEIPSAFAPEVTAFGTNGFDLFSSGIQQFDDYEETTFVGERLEGDFERIVRVEWIDPAGFGAKAGIMVRENLDEERPRTSEPSFSRYIQLAVSAPTTGTGAGGNLAHQILRRAATGDIFTESLSVTNDLPPAFPDAWLRLQKVGNEFRMFRGTNGFAWQQIGSTRFPTPATNGLYVGLSFSPQNDDQPPNLKRAYVAKFRSYSGANSPVLRIDIARVGAQTEVSWRGLGILQVAPAVTGQWQDSTNQANPQVVDFSGPGARFFRLRRPN